MTHPEPTPESVTETPFATELTPDLREHLAAVLPSPGSVASDTLEEFTEALTRRGYVIVPIVGPIHPEPTPDTEERDGYWDGGGKHHPATPPQAVSVDGLTALELAEFDERTESWNPVFRGRVRAALATEKQKGEVSDPEDS